MKAKKGISNNMAVFSKWSRKSYAIFTSLKKVVKIGRLSIDICNSSLRKALSSVCLNKQEKSDESESEDTFDVEMTPRELLFFLISQPTTCKSEISHDIIKIRYFNLGLCCNSTA